MHRSTLHLDTIASLISSLSVWECGGYGMERCVAAAQAAVYSQSRLLPPPLPKLVAAQWAMVQVLTHDSCQGSVKLVTVARMV